MSVVVKVEELVAPLGHDSYRVFDEGTDDEKATGCWYVPRWDKRNELNCSLPKQ